ncbi:hypothetical protein SE23_01310 [Vibrio sinaloensis]|uniref:hypothetical protein n=1 Tax=Vibrio TaxID=662 RepID=UPI00057E1ABF|nr:MULTISPECIES: hypothetical protein [Vibrio]KIE22704.1 hypothetical protein SE23_01310 [Vibrio sinaloensis]QLE30643.1 hypothetical protein FDV78_08780 [Vibrio parahaemolyticus]TOF97015.1 hypothetical protein CGJ11_23185 [Vibrio parahaemolyticus]
MESVIENGWLNFGVSLLIALSVCFAIELLLKKVLKPKGLWWVFILIFSVCIFLVASTLNSNESFFYWFISSAKWALVGVAGLSIAKLRES